MTDQKLKEENEVGTLFRKAFNKLFFLVFVLGLFWVALLGRAALADFKSDISPGRADIQAAILAY